MDNITKRESEALKKKRCYKDWIIYLCYVMLSVFSINLSVSRTQNTKSTQITHNNNLSTDYSSPDNWWFETYKTKTHSFHSGHATDKCKNLLYNGGWDESSFKIEGVVGTQNHTIINHPYGKFE